MLNDSAVSVKVNELVPKGRNINEMNFISFEVNISEKHYKNAVMNANFRPKGVTVCIFVICNCPFMRRHTRIFLTGTPTAPTPMSIPAKT